MPRAWRAVNRYSMRPRVRAAGWSGRSSVRFRSVAVVRRMLAGEAVTQETSGMPKGEWREFEAMLKD